MAKTYKTVINNAITGFNRIQNKINSITLELDEVNPSNSSTIASIDEIVNALNAASITLQCDTYNVDISTVNNSGIRISPGWYTSTTGLIGWTGGNADYYIDNLRLPSGKSIKIMPGTIYADYWKINYSAANDLIITI